MFLFENLQMSLEELQDKIWCNVCQKTITVSEYRKHLGQHPGVLEFDTAVTCIFCYECMNMGEYLQSHECPNTKCKYCQNICKKESKSHVPSKYDKIAPCNDSINRRIRDRLRADTAEWILKSKSSDKSIGST